MAHTPLLGYSPRRRRASITGPLARKLPHVPLAQLCIEGLRLRRERPATFLGVQPALHLPPREKVIVVMVGRVAVLPLFPVGILLVKIVVEVVVVVVTMMHKLLLLLIVVVVVGGNQVER